MVFNIDISSSFTEKNYNPRLHSEQEPQVFQEEDPTKGTAASLMNRGTKSSPVVPEHPDIRIRGSR